MVCIKTERKVKANVAQVSSKLPLEKGPDSSSVSLSLPYLGMCLQKVGPRVQDQFSCNICSKTGYFQVIITMLGINN